jgi:beta-glucosidase
VEHVGDRDGDEVVELYLRHPDVQGKSPIHALNGFERIHLGKGERRTIHFSLSTRQLSIVKANGDRVEQPGLLEIYLGGGQPLPAALANGSVVRKTVKLTGQELLVDPYPTIP